MILTHKQVRGWWQSHRTSRITYYSLDGEDKEWDIQRSETELTQATLHATTKTCRSEFHGAGTMEASTAVHVQPFDICLS